MMGSVNCIYETPCGWCSKWDKKCDRKIQAYAKTYSDELATRIDELNSAVDKVVSTKASICGRCGNSVIDTSSSVVRLKCLVSGRLHFHDDFCDCDTITAAN